MREILPAADIATLVQEAKDPKTIAEKATPALQQGRPPKAEKEKGRQPTFSGKQDSSYLTARIARDRPDGLARMKAGEFSAANVSR